MTWSGSYGNDAWSLNQILQRTGDAAALTCLNNMIQQINTTCKNYTTFGVHLDASPTGGVFSKNYDDCFVSQLAGWAFPDWNKPYWWSTPESRLGTQSNGAVCTHLHRTDLWYCPPSVVNNNVNGCHGCAEGRFYFDSSCRIVQPNPALEICGTITTNYQLSCPVSLVWDGKVDLEAQTSAVQFPLDPRQSGYWYEWKASEQAPLLVYDPEHTGKINSASQLFGQWTFGGQRLAALASDGRGLVSGPWENGFDALATLDADGSGILEGSELEPLALWFDKDRNGVADQAEVKTLSEAQVTKLYFNHDSVNKATNSIQASIGYERLVDGKPVTGASVDWFASSALTPFELLSLAGKQAGTAEVLQEAPVVQSSAASSRSDTRLSGIWAFRFEGVEQGQFPAGYLVMSDHPERGLTGYSVVDKAFRLHGSEEANNVVSFFALQGAKQAGADGKVSVNFSIQREGSAPLVSNALLSADLRRMEGQSSMDAGGRTLSYRWTAERMQ